MVRGATCAALTPARSANLNYRSKCGAGSGRIDDSQGGHRVIRVDRHGGLRILGAKRSFHPTVEVDLSSRWAGHRSALCPYVDPPALRRTGVGQVWIDAGSIVLELVQQEGPQSQNPHSRSGRGSDGRRAQVGHHARCMPARQERIILSSCGAGCDLGIDRVDRAEQIHRRVDNVAVQIEQNTAAVSS